MNFDRARALLQALTLDLLACSKDGKFPSRVKLTHPREDYVAAIGYIDTEARNRRLVSAEMMRLTRVMASAIEYYSQPDKVSP